MLVKVPPRVVPTQPPLPHLDSTVAAMPSIVDYFCVCGGGMLPPLDPASLPHSNMEPIPTIMGEGLTSSCVAGPPQTITQIDNRSRGRY